jgi:hypothetical protein
MKMIIMIEATIAKLLLPILLQIVERIDLWRDNGANSAQLMSENETKMNKRSSIQSKHITTMNMEMRVKRE